MATTKQYNRDKAIINAVNEGIAVRQYEQTYRDAYVDGFAGCMEIIEQWTKLVKGLKNKSSLQAAHNLLQEYYQQQLALWKISSVEKDLPPPAFPKK